MIFKMTKFSFVLKHILSCKAVGSDLEIQQPMKKTCTKNKKHNTSFLLVCKLHSAFPRMIKRKACGQKPVVEHNTKREKRM